jgi:uncharacterized tellurite resistance protein B-like protein
MKTLMNPIDLELRHVRVMVQGMMRIAHSDGTHPRELALIRAFYESCRADAKGLAEFDDLVNVPYEPESAKEVFDTPELKSAFLTSCFLVAYADGNVSDAEAKTLVQMGKELGVEGAAFEEARERVKDQLLQQLTGSENLVALAKIASQL